MHLGRRKTPGREELAELPEEDRVASAARTLDTVSRQISNRNIRTTYTHNIITENIKRHHDQDQVVMIVMSSPTNDMIRSNDMMDAKWERQEAANAADRRSGLMNIVTPLWSMSE